MPTVTPPRRSRRRALAAIRRAFSASCVPACRGGGLVRAPVRAARTADTGGRGGRGARVHRRLRNARSPCARGAARRLAHLHADLGRWAGRAAARTRRPTAASHERAVQAEQLRERAVPAVAHRGGPSALTGVGAVERQYLPDSAGAAVRVTGPIGARPVGSLE